MFERYTERARRVVFFARYEASQFGSVTIESEHLLLGLVRESKELINRFLVGGSLPNIRKEIEGRSTIREKVSTSIDLPLSNECKRILAYAAEESERLNQRHIGTEHVLLGILHEEKCIAAETLHVHGVRLDAVRESLSGQPMPPEFGSPEHTPDSPQSHRAGMGLFPFLHSPALPQEGVVRDEETAIRIAEAICRSLYSPAVVESQRPLKADLKYNVVWVVAGSPSENEEPLSVFMLKADGRILAVGGESARQEK